MAMYKTGSHHRKSSISAAKIVRGIILMASVALLISGVLSDGHKDVRNKAVRICYECIGIG